MKKVIIFGTAAFSEVVYYYLSKDDQYEVVAFTANKCNIDNTEYLGLPVVPFEVIESKYDINDHELFVSVGYKDVNQVRASIFSQVKAKGYHMLTYISPKCNYMASSIGENCFIMEDNTVQPFVEIGDDVIMWSGNHIGHHTKIGSHCFITSHAVISGNVIVGDYCFIGVNSTIRDSITIGNSCVVGAGAIIMSSTPDKSVYVAQKTPLYKKSSEEINM